MAVLNELCTYKDKLLDLLCSDERIVQLLLDEEDVEVPDCDLPFKVVFPYNYVSENTTQEKTYICFDIEVPEVQNSTSLEYDLYIWAFCHESKIPVKGGGTRPDQLAMQIQRLLSLSNDFGKTPLMLESVASVSPIKEHWGKILQYKTVAFNTPNTARNELRGSMRRRIP